MDVAVATGTHESSWATIHFLAPMRPSCRVSAIGNCVIVGAGSVVTESVPDGIVVAGNPAIIVRKFAALGKRVLEHYPAADNMVGRTWRERINSMVEKDFCSNLKK